MKNDVICFFSGKFSNTNDLVETYGLKDVTNGANIVIDIYGKTQPQDIKNWHSALANFQGEYSFVLYDPKTLQFFASTVKPDIPLIFIPNYVIFFNFITYLLHVLFFCYRIL